MKQSVCKLVAQLLNKLYMTLTEALCDHLINAMLKVHVQNKKKRHISYTFEHALQ